MTGFEEIAPLADRLRRGFLVTRRPDGGPTVHPLTPIYAEGAVHINTYRKSAKVQNALRDPRVSYVVTTKDDGWPFRAFEARGTARILDPDEIPDSFFSVGTAGDVIGQVDLDRVRARLASGKRVYLRVEAQEWVECEPLVPQEAVDEAGPGAVGPGASGWEAVLAPARIAMSAGEIVEFLGRTGTAILGTVDGEDRPRGRPARYLALDGQLDVLVPEASPSLGDLARDPRAAVTVEDFPSYSEIRGVMAHGRAEVTAGPAGAGWSRVGLEAARVLSFDFSKIPNAH